MNFVASLPYGYGPESRFAGRLEKEGFKMPVVVAVSSNLL